MKTIGIIGGMSWESTAVYYRLLNEEVRQRFGGLRSAKVIVHSLDFEPVVALQSASKWNEAGRVLGDAASSLERAGADMLLLATNTMHLVSDHIKAASTLPFIHICDVTADALVAAGKRKPLLLATRFTMEQAFYRDRLKARGIDAVVPEQSERDEVHRIIFEELCCGVIKPESRAAYLDIIHDARRHGIDCVIFGCTEIGLLLSPSDVPEGAFDTTELHCRAAILAALNSAQSKAA